MTKKRPMPPDEFRRALERLGFARSGAPNDIGESDAARLFGYTSRQVRNWASPDGDGLTAGGVIVAVRLMLKLKLSAEKVRKLIGDDDG